MVHIMNCTGEDGSEDLKVCEHSLRGEKAEHRQGEGENID